MKLEEETGRIVMKKEKMKDDKKTRKKLTEWMRTKYDRKNLGGKSPTKTRVNDAGIHSSQKSVCPQNTSGFSRY